MIAGIEGLMKPCGGALSFKYKSTISESLNPKCTGTPRTKGGRRRKVEVGQSLNINLSER
jgi:hypothetical protein